MKYFAACFCLLALASPVWGQTSREVVQRGKAATALVELDKGKQTASAVCVHSSGIFITNHHVVEDVGKGGDIKLVLHPNEESQRELKAKVVRLDKPLDLAVLQVEEGKDFAALPLGDDAALYETMSVTAFGFPFGKSLAVKEDTLPDISINVGRVTALRKREGALNQIQIDAQLNPGNSGGPLIDETGKIIGIVTKGVFATGVNFATPVSGVKQLLQRPEISFTPPKLTAANLHEETEFNIEIVPFLQELTNVAVELELQTDGLPPRKFLAKPNGKHLHVIKAIPQIKSPQAAPLRVNARVTFASGNVTGVIEDRAFKIGSQSLRLADVSAIDNDGTWRIKRHEGESLEGPAEGLSDVPILFGNYAVNMDLAQAKSIQLQRIPVEEPSLRYTLVIRSTDAELHRATGVLRAGSQSTDGGAVAWKPYQGERQVLELPDLVADACLGKGGQYVLLYLKKTRKIAVYDANQAKIVKYLSIAADDALMAASLDKLIVVSPGSNVVERWSLDTLERESSDTLSLGVIKAIALGYASNGPLLIHSAAGTDALARATYDFYDVQTLERIPMGEFRGHNTSYRDFVHIRAAGTGDVFGLWATSHSPQGMESMTLEGTNVKVAYQHNSAGHIVPNYDGSAIATGNQGICTSELTRKGQRGEQTLPLIPSTHPRFMVTVPTDPGAQINLGREPFKGRTGAVRLIDADQDLVPLPDLQLGQTDIAATSWARHDFTLDKRVFYIQQADQVISIPYTNDKLIVQPFNLKEALDRTNSTYLFVSSTPPVWFEKGTTFRYAIQAHCKRGTVEMELASGPPGMTVSGNELVWEVPTLFPEKALDVIVNITSSEGQRTLHVFKLRPRLKK